jgi:hypothetical protein
VVRSQVATHDQRYWRRRIDLRPIRGAAGSAAAPACQMQKTGTWNFHGVPSLNDGRCVCLLSLDLRRLDDRPPLLYFGLLQRPKRLWRLLVASRNLKALIGEALANFRIS